MLTTRFYLLSHNYFALKISFWLEKYDCDLNAFELFKCPSEDEMHVYRLSFGDIDSLRSLNDSVWSLRVFWVSILYFFEIKFGKPAWLFYISLFSLLVLMLLRPSILFYVNLFRFDVDKMGVSVQLAYLTWWNEWTSVLFWTSKTRFFDTGYILLVINSR